MSTDGDGDDPLDAFMADIKKEAAKPSAPKAIRHARILAALALS